MVVKLLDTASLEGITNAKEDRKLLQLDKTVKDVSSVIQNKL